MSFDKLKRWLINRRLRRVDRRLAAVQATRDDLTEEAYQLLAKQRRLQHQANWRFKPWTT